MPGAFDQVELSPVYANRTPVDVLNGVIALNQHQMQGQRQAAGQRYWSTPRRAFGDTISDVMEVSFNTARRVNSLTFELAHFPQQCLIQWFDDDANSWEDCTTPQGDLAVVHIYDSVPSRIISMVQQQTKEHPKSASGSW